MTQTHDFYHAHPKSEWRFSCRSCWSLLRQRLTRQQITYAAPSTAFDIHDNTFVPSSDPGVRFSTHNKEGQ